MVLGGLATGALKIRVSGVQFPPGHPLGIPGLESLAIERPPELGGRFFV